MRILYYMSFIKDVKTLRYNIFSAKISLNRKNGALYIQKLRHIFCIPVWNIIADFTLGHYIYSRNSLWNSLQNVMAFTGSNNLCISLKQVASYIFVFKLYFTFNIFTTTASNGNSNRRKVERQFARDYVVWK